MQFSPGVTIWGSVCSMSVGVAEVVCRQAGYSGSGNRRDTCRMYLESKIWDRFVGVDINDVIMESMPQVKAILAQRRQ